MADEIIKEDDIEVIEVETLPTPAEIAARADTGADTQTAAEDHDDDEDDGDSRLAEDHSQDGDTDAVREARREKQRDRKRKQRESRDRTIKDLDDTKAALAEERRQRTAMEERLARLEGTTVENRKVAIDDKLSEAKRHLASIDDVIAKAIEAGNGEDVVAAQRLRDSTRDFMADLEGQKKQLATPAERPTDTRIAALASQWKGDNASWYDGANEESRIANAIEAGLAAEGFDPATVIYWKELTTRTAKRLNGAAPVAAQTTTTPRKEPPPMGATREHAPASTRTEVYVTPERKQAMQEAGIWDDPVRRARVLKQYAEHDRSRQA